MMVKNVLPVGIRGLVVAGLLAALMSSLAGVFNACAPGLATNAEFTQALARALHRPAILPAPAWALRLALGEMSVLLLGGQRLQPRRAQEAGFVFRYPELGAALAQVA